MRRFIANRAENDSYEYWVWLVKCTCMYKRGANHEKSLLTVQTLCADCLSGATFLHHSLSRWTLQAAFSAIGELARVTFNIQGPLSLWPQHKRRLKQWGQSHLLSHMGKLMKITARWPTCFLNLTAIRVHHKSLCLCLYWRDFAQTCHLNGLNSSPKGISVLIMNLKHIQAGAGTIKSCMSSVMHMSLLFNVQRWELASASY